MAKNKKKRKLTPAQQQARKERLANLGLALKTLVNNDACIKASREWKGFQGHGVPIIVGILSVLLALIPSLVSRLNVSAGNTFLGSPNYSYDVGISNFTKAMNEHSIHVRVEDGVLKTEGDLDLVFGYTETTSEVKWYHEETTRYETKVITSSETSSSEAVAPVVSKKTTFEAFINTLSISDDEFFLNLTGDSGASKTPDGKYRDTLIGWNYIAFGKNEVVFAEYKEDGTMYTYLRGQYDRLNGYDFASSNAVSADLKGDEFIKATAEKWKNVLNLSYESTKIMQTFQYIEILSGVYAGLLILFGFLIWVMTRGKNNPMRIFTFWQTQRMAYWASFAPAVLSIPVGFMMSSSAIGMFGFIFLFGMRIMWMSMKALRPAQ